VGQNELLRLIRRGTNNYIDTLLSEQILRAPAHTACNYYIGASLCEPAWQEAWLVWGSIDFPFGEDLFGLQISIYEREALTVPKVCTEPSVS